MSKGSPTTVIGCVLEVCSPHSKIAVASNAVRLSDGALRAAVNRAIHIAQMEYGRDDQSMFIVLSGLKHESTGGRPYVDLCAVAEALLGGNEDDLSGHEFLIQLAIEKQIAWISDFILADLSKTESFKLAAYLRRFPRGLVELGCTIPPTLWRRIERIAVFGTMILVMLMGIGLSLWHRQFTHVFLAFYFALGIANAVHYLDRYRIRKSGAKQLAQHMSEDWLVGLDSPRARPIAEVIDLLQRLKHRLMDSCGIKVAGVSFAGLLMKHMDTNVVMARDTFQLALYQALVTFKQHAPCGKRLLVVSDDNLLGEIHSQPLHELQQTSIFVEINP